MIKRILAINLCLVFCQSAHAFPSLKDFQEGARRLGNAVMDINSLGERGRQNDRQFEQKKVEIAAIQDENMKQARAKEIARLSELIKVYNAAKAGHESIINKNILLQSTLSEINNYYKQQLTGAVQIQNKVELSKESSEELSSDLKLIIEMLNHIAIPSSQAYALGLLNKVAEERGLQLNEFISSSFELAQLNRSELNKIYNQISIVLPNFDHVVQETQIEINEIQEKITTHTGELNAINQAIAKEQADVVAAQAAAEQARIQAAQRAAQIEEEQRIHRLKNKNEFRNSKYAN